MHSTSSEGPNPAFDIIAGYLPLFDNNRLRKHRCTKKWLCACLPACLRQVRCMAAVLLMVGRGLEEPSIVSRLLDITATPRKPTYQMAAEVCAECGGSTWHAV